MTFLVTPKAYNFLIAFLSFFVKLPLEHKHVMKHFGEEHVSFEVSLRAR
jgi:hypothetical protein